MTEAAACYFLVWSPSGQPPRKRHDDFNSASTEAQRLASIKRGRTFVVLRSMVEFCDPPEAEIP